MVFLFSFVLVVWTSLVICRWMGRNPAEMFWLCFAAAGLQLGTLATVTSLISQMTPAGWISAQVLLSLAVAYSAGVLSRASVRNYRAAALEVWSGARGNVIEFAASLSPTNIAVFIGILLFLLLSGIAQIFTPIYVGDEKMYHASRVMYWIQNHSVFPYTTHNDRQTVFTFGSELFFLWPVLLTRTEVVGRVIFWLGYPFAAVGQYCVLRALRVSRGGSLTGVLILVSTPIVTNYSIGLKPEMWFATGVLGVTFWAVTMCAAPDSIVRNSFFLGLFTFLAVDFRPLALALVPIVMALPFCVIGLDAHRTRAKALAAGMLFAFAASSVAVPFGFNLVRHGHILGPEAMRKVHAAEISGNQLYTHAVRLPFLLAELPDIPAPDSLRSGLSAVGNKVIAAVGADKPLPLEDRPWPGRYVYTVPEFGARFSVWGLLWLPVLVIAGSSLLKNLLVTWPQLKLGPVSVVAALAIPLLCVIVFSLRWMVHSGLPDRFLIAPYALAVPLGLVLLEQHVRSRKAAEALAMIVIAGAVYIPLRQLVGKADTAVITPVSQTQIEEPFQEALACMPPHSRILLVGSGIAPDYPLFSPRTHYTNQVIPWGQARFNPQRLQSLMKTNAVTHVLIENDQSAFFHWAPEISTGEMVAWLTQQPDLIEFPLGTPHMRLFGSRTSRPAPQALEVSSIPAAAPLIVVDSALRNQVGIDRSFLKTPWPVENLGAAEQGFLWMGQGPVEGVEFALWSGAETTVRLQLAVSPGPSRTDATRTVSLLLNGVPLADHQTFTGNSSLGFPSKLNTGRNRVQFFVWDQVTVPAMPNGDTRHLLAGLHEVRIEPLQKTGKSQ